MRDARARAAIVAATVAAAALLGRGALAHHSPAAYDVQAQRTVEGTVTDYEWGNPHVYLSVRENGSERVWVVEAFSSTAMKGYGWSPGTFQAGDRVVVAGNPGRTPDRTVLFLRTVRKADAAALLFDAATALGATARPSGPRANALAGTWLTLVGPAFFNLIPPAVAQAATSRGAAALQAYRDADGPGAACVAYPAPLYMSFPGFRRIEERSGAIVIRGEDTAVDRIVHLDVATHDGAAASLQGHSIGRWENGTLLVDTARFTPHALGNGAGLPSGPGKHLVERFALNADGGLTYSFELEDPDYLQGRMTGSAQWVSRPDVEFVATPCDLTNARRFLAE